jgi:hypothetical protein
MKPRSIFDVANRVAKCVPEDWAESKVFLQELNNIMKDAAYQAPETHGDYWYRLFMLLNRRLGEPDTDWKQKINDIMTDKAGETHDDIQ